MQPTIRPLFDTKQFQDVLLELIGTSTSYHDYIKSYWKTNILKETSWNDALHDGVYMSSSSATIETADAFDASEITSLSAALKTLATTTANGIELTLYPKTGMGDGQQANNPWLQEFPDPLTRTTWDNYLTVSEFDAKELGFYLETSTFFSQNSHDANGGLNGKYANITVNGATVKVPVIIQPGQARGSMGMSFGYGRSKGLRLKCKPV